MPTGRALLAASVPGVLTFLVFLFWLGVGLPAAALFGLLWGFASLLVTRVLYDDEEAETAAWREASRADARPTLAAEATATDSSATTAAATRPADGESP